MMVDLTAEWIAEMKQTMAVDIGRGLRSGRSPAEVVEMLFNIPEVAEAMHMRAQGKRPLPMSLDTPEDRARALERMESVATFLDDGFHEPIVEGLRKVIGDIAETG